MSDTLATRYDTEATGWHGMLSRLGYDAAYDRLCAAAPELLHARSILDAGCGSGALSLAAIRAGATTAQLTLLDPSSAMLEEAARRLGQADPQLLEMKLDGLAGLTARFDAILCAHVIEHCDDPIAELRALRSALSPGGILVLSVSKPHWCTAILRWKWGSKAYREGTVHQMLTKAGFERAQTVTYAKGPPSRTSLGYVAYAG